MDVPSTTLEDNPGMTHIIFVNRWDFAHNTINTPLENKSGVMVHYGKALLVYIDTQNSNLIQYNTITDFLFKHAAIIHNANKPIIMVTGNNNYLGIDMLERLINKALSEHGIFENCIQIKEWQIRNILKK